jgi:hypothetical protein
MTRGKWHCWGYYVSNHCSKKIRAHENNPSNDISKHQWLYHYERGPNYNIEIANKIALTLWDKTDEDVLNKSIFDKA